MEEKVDENKEQNEEKKENSAFKKESLQDNENSDNKQDEKKITEQNNESETEKTENDENASGVKQEDEQKTIPSVEISQHVENFDSDPEKPQLLSVIEEERSPASSVLELIEADNLSTSSDIPINPSFSLNEDQGNIKQQATQEEQEKPNISPGLRKTIEDKNIVKENEVLKARITEVNEHLAEARKKITELQKDLAEFNRETKNPTILQAKLTESIQENDQLKKQISNQTALAFQANNKETELRERVVELIASEEKKQNQIERLEAKVAELVNFIQTTSSRDGKNENGQTSVNPEDLHFLTDSVRKLNRKKNKSKICAIL